MITILVATQRKIPFPLEEIYRPIHVGAALGSPVDGFLTDDTGDNISQKNQSYCELTAVYWAWKNISSEYIGLNHYRRYFAGKAIARNKFSRIAAKEDIAQALQKAPVLLPKKRNYFIETNYSQYVHAHHKQDLDTTRQILTELHPESLTCYDAVMSRTTGHRFNMFVMRRDCFESYCAWLFPVLFELERRLDIRAYSSYDKRVFGFVAERLLDVWLEVNGIPYTHLPVVFTEKQNWLKKGSQFLIRKFCKTGS